jgi:hypothetical protein
LAYVGAEGGNVYVKRTVPMDKRQFRRYLETCRRLGFRFDRLGERWVKLVAQSLRRRRDGARPRGAL